MNNSMYLCAAIVAVIGLIIGIRSSGKLESIAGGIVGGGIVGVIVGGILSLALSSLCGMTTVEEGKWDLAAMRTMDTVGGVFVWDTGSIDGSTMYRVMIVHKDGSMSPWQASANNDNTTIVEDSELHDKGVLVIRKRTYDPQSPWFNWTAHIRDNERWFYEYRVPKGTVRNTFDAR